MLLMGYFLALLFILSGIVVTLAYLKRSWGGMLLGAIVLSPFAWFISWYPPYPWAIYVPVVLLILAGILFVRRKQTH